MFVTVEAPVCEEPPPTLTYENPDGSSITPIKVGAVTWTAFDIYRWQCCCGDLSGAGQIVTADPTVIGGSRGMEADFAVQVVPFLTQTNPSAVGVFDSTSLTGWTRTRDTSRLMLSATLMPAAFGQTGGTGAEPLLIELKGDKLGATKFGMAQVTAPMIGAGRNRRTSALNAFANRFLTKNGGLTFVDLGRFTGAGTTQIGSTAYLVEQVRHVSGDGSITADSIGVQVEVVVRIYTAGTIGP